MNFTEPPKVGAKIIKFGYFGRHKYILTGTVLTVDNLKIDIAYSYANGGELLRCLEWRSLDFEEIVS